MPKSYYAVMPDAKVYRCASVKQALTIEGAVAASDTDLSEVPTALLVKLHNLVRPERPVVRFSDRATAEKRLEGVLDLLAKPFPGGEAQPKSEEKPSKGKRGEPVVTPMFSKPKGEGAKRGAKPKEISPEMMQEVMRLRKEGNSWDQIVATLNQPKNFIHRARAVMKQMDPGSVKLLGPGSPGYGSGPKPRPAREPGAPRARKVAKAADRGVPVEAF